MKHLILAAALAALGTSAHAALIDVSAHAGYTTLSLGDFNNGTSAMWGWDGDGFQQTIHSGYVVGLDACTQRLTHWDWLSLGLRGEYLQSNEGQVNEPSGGYYFQNMGTLTSLLVGGKFSLPSSVPGLELGLGAWIGGGYATMSQSAAFTSGYSFSAPIQSGLFDGELLEGQLEGTMKYALNQRVSLVLTGGWRWADAPELKDGSTPLCSPESYTFGGPAAPVNVDFSGATAQGSVGYSF
jgi:hypothetical protein